MRLKRAIRQALKEKKPLAVIHKVRGLGDAISIEPLLRTLHQLGITIWLVKPKWHSLYYYHPQVELSVNNIKKLPADIPYVRLRLICRGADRSHIVANYFRRAGLPVPQDLTPNVYFQEKPIPSFLSPYAVLAASASQPARCYPYWNAVVSRLKMPVVVVDKNRKQFPTETSGYPLYNMTGDTDLYMMLTIVKYSSLVISADTGLFHAAAALRKPRVVIFGTVSPEYRCYGGQEYIVQKTELSCLGCQHANNSIQRRCHLGYAIPPCMDIDPVYLSDFINQTWKDITTQYFTPRRENRRL